MNKKQIEIVRRITEDHVNPPKPPTDKYHNRGITDKEFWDNAMSLFPSFAFNGKARRALECCKNTLDYNDLKVVGTSWSKTKEGNDIFIENNIFRPYIVIECNISGFDLNALLNWIVLTQADNEEIDFPRVHSYKDEDEIVLLEILGTVEFIEESENPSLYYSKEETDKREAMIKFASSIFEGRPRVAEEDQSEDIKKKENKDE